jgi:Chaperone of endosialidase
MSMGGGGTQTVVNKTELPEWVQEAGRRNLAAAYEVSRTMPGPYEGQRVAAMTPGQVGTIGTIANNYAMAQPAFAYAQQMAAQAGQYQPERVQAGSLAQTSLDPYMNPYTQNVLQTSLDTLNQQRLMGLNQASDAAIKARAFGGSRQAIQEAVVNAAAQQQAGQLAAQLMSQNFAQAQAAAQGDIQRQMAAQQLNQAAGLQGAGLGITGAQALGGLAGAGQQNFLQGAASALAAQEAIQAQQQAELDAARQAYAEQQAFPAQQLNLPIQALGLTPYGGTSTQTSSGGSGSPLLTGLGAASTGIGILSGLKSLAAPAAGAAAAGAAGGGGFFSTLASALPFLLGGSDERMKTDIQKLGKDKETGVDMYAYRYKGDPKTYPKVVGPMAQDIEKKYPDMVKEVAGKKAVDVRFPSMLKGFK